MKYRKLISISHFISHRIQFLEKEYDFHNETIEVSTLYLGLSLDSEQVHDVADVTKLYPTPLFYSVGLINWAHRLRHCIIWG